MKSKKLRIIHCFRSPVGGIFRHVRDLVEEQVRAGHDVGVICDNNTGGALEEQLLSELEPTLSLGLHRLPMDRGIGPRDGFVIWKLYKDIKALDVEVLHAHGAKGGAYARIIGSGLGTRNNRPARIYCPHGGSVHYDQSKLSGRIYFNLERLLEKVTDRLIFVSKYERDGYFEKVGATNCPYSLAQNGLRESDFEIVTPSSDASDFLYIGMMRDLKGVDLFLDALPLAATATGKTVSATLVGNGPDLEQYKQRVDKFDESVSVTFLDAKPSKEVFPMGKTMIVPSRAESMPYIVLEALAAQIPLIATNAGGIPEIYADQSSLLIEAGNLDALSSAMINRLNGERNIPEPKSMAKHIKRYFSAEKMGQDVLEAYQLTLQGC